MLSNLLENAIKFTPARGGSVSVSIHASARADRVRISVQDHGPGIRREDLPHIFERFWRASRLGVRGTGLGLYIPRGIVDAHGGRIWAETEAGRGTTFHVEIPRIVVPAAPKEGEDAAATGSAP